MNENKKASIGKIIVILFILALAVASFTDLYNTKAQPSHTESQAQGSLLLKVRNMRIKSIIPNIKRSKSCIYSQDDIVSAADAVKENFMNRDVYVSLTSIKYDEKACNSIRDNSTVFKDIEKAENCIVLLCSYNVYKDFAAYSAGYYDGYNVILARESQASPWEIKDMGYA